MHFALVHQAVIHLTRKDSAMPTNTRSTGFDKSQEQSKKPERGNKRGKNSTGGEPQKRTIHGGRSRTGSDSNKRK
jgi:hypothetical protein